MPKSPPKLESLDIPTVLLGRTDFLGVIRNAVSGLGLPPETAVVAFPVDTFLPGSDLTAIQARKREFYDGLTGEETFSIEGLAGAIASRKVTVRATRADGSVREIHATVRVDTPQEREYYRHGGILQYVLRQLIEK